MATRAAPVVTSPSAPSGVNGGITKSAESWAMAAAEPRWTTRPSQPLRSARWAAPPRASAPTTAEALAKSVKPAPPTRRSVPPEVGPAAGAVPPTATATYK